MKRLLTLLLLLIIPVTSRPEFGGRERLFGTPEQIAQRNKRISEETIRLANDLSYLKFALTKKFLEPKFYGFATVSCAKEIAKEIHNRLETELRSGKNCAQAGKSLNQKLDAPIVNECANIEKRLRTKGDHGTVCGKDPLAWISSNGSGETFFENACPCKFYKNLTDKQLEELIKGTTK